MMNGCIGDCSQCPFYFEEVSAKKRQPVETEVPKEDVVVDESENTSENNLSIVESTPQYVVKKNIFGKDKVVLVKE